MTIRCFSSFLITLSLFTNAFRTSVVCRLCAIPQTVQALTRGCHNLRPHMRASSWMRAGESRNTGVGHGLIGLTPTKFILGFAAGNALPKKRESQHEQLSCMGHEEG